MQIPIPREPLPAPCLLGEEAARTDGGGLTELLLGQIADARRVVNAHYDDASRILRQHAESMRRVESELGRVQAENHQLRRASTTHYRDMGIQRLDALCCTSVEFAEILPGSTPCIEQVAPTPQRHDAAKPSVDTCSSRQHLKSLLAPATARLDRNAGGTTRFATSKTRSCSGMLLAQKTASLDTVRSKEVPNRAPHNVFGLSEDQQAHVQGRDELRERVRATITAGPMHAVTDFYHKSGVWQSVARSSTFDHITLCVITLNVIWLAVDSDLNRKSDNLLDSPMVFQVMEHFFCVFFVCELSIRFAAFACKRDCLKDIWFVFDAALVSLSVLDTWAMTVAMAIMRTNAPHLSGNASILRLFRLLRLTRVVRIAKLLRQSPELMILIRGIRAATRAVFFTLCLLVLVVYVFGIAFVQLTKDTVSGERYFPTVLSSMGTLLLHGCFGEDLPDVVYFVAADNFMYAMLLLVFVFVASLTILNMLMGVLVEVVSNVASAEKAALAAEFVKDQLQQSWEELDDDRDNLITQMEFEALLDKPKAAKALFDVGVDVVGLVDLAEFIFESGSTPLNFNDFVDLVLKLRSSNSATAKDIFDLQRFFSQEVAKLEARLPAVDVAGMV